jgi:predicted RNA-binding protein with TRAM domain
LVTALQGQVMNVSEENKEEQAVSEERVEENAAGAQDAPEEAAAEKSAASAGEEAPKEEPAAEQPAEEEKAEDAPEEEGGADEAPPKSGAEETPPEAEGSSEEGEKPREGRKNIADLPKPVKVGDEIEVTIESVGAKGDGIAKKDGFVIFVPGVQRGDTVKIKIAELKTSFAIGEKV